MADHFMCVSENIEINADKLKKTSQYNENVEDTVKPLAPRTDSVQYSPQRVGDSAPQQEQKSGGGQNLFGL